ncbi:hypothetical protein FA95DRAFT_1463009, partial [Auriscalpium vulgare]
MNIKGNAEQEQAMRTIGEHFIQEKPDQLLLYILGVGGTGKSHLIKSVRRFFESCAAGDQLFISAPTGIASVLIKGHTVHALTFLPSS